MNINHFNLRQISSDFKIGLKDYSSLFSGGMSLNNYLINHSYVNDIKSGRTPSRFTPEYWNGDYEFITMPDVDTTTYTLNKTIEDKITDEAIINEKTLLQVPENSLIISNAMTIGLAFIVDRPVYINQNVFWVNVDTEKVNKKFLMWYFNCHIRRVFQKTYSAKYLSKLELSRINVPNIGIEQQNDFEKSIANIEEKINTLKNSIRPHSEIIDKVFKKYFKYDYDKFNELKKQKIYNTALLKFSNNVDARFSVKFHRPAGDYVLEELNRITSKKIKNYLSEPIQLGSSISPSDFDELGDCYYISMATVKNYKVELDETQLVSKSYEKENQDKLVKKDDIIMTRSGVAIGKFALVEEDTNGVFADFTMRIRLKNYNPIFAYYYFRSMYFQYLIEVFKKGVQNQNIFPIVIQEFPIPDIPKDEQKKIADEINEEIEKQKKIEENILKERNKIEQILSDVLKEPN